MATRRQVLAGLLATGLVPAPTWAEAGNPAFVTAAKTPDGAFALVGLRQDLTEAFRLPLPARGHAAAAHPNRPEVVAFARRPGTYALVIDCRAGAVIARLDAAAGRHFFGHGVFSEDGNVLFTTENDYENARGVVGIWDARNGFARIGEFDSGGVGPHEIALMPNSETLVIANGGIETHPESGRAKLNIPMMRPNLTYARFDGDIVETIKPDPALRRNSIRHLAVAPDGAVQFAMQWQGSKHEIVPLAGTHRMGDGGLSLFQAKGELWRRMQGYAGSIATSLNGEQVAVTSPRGNVAVFLDARSNAAGDVVALKDVCGIAFAETGFVVTTGGGVMTALRDPVQRATDLSFDNHLLRI